MAAIEAAAIPHDFVSLLSSPDRDFLLRNNGHQVKIDTLKGKKLGLYFSGLWCGRSRRFTPTLVEVYNELILKDDFEIVFVSHDDDESFEENFSKMPWLAIPFDSEAEHRLHELTLPGHGIPTLVILSEDGKILTKDGVGIIRDYGVEGHPFTPERIKELKDQDEEAKRSQSLRSLLVSESRDYLIGTNGKKVLVSELEGKTIGLYFSSFSSKPCSYFASTLAEVYDALKAKGENFEVVVVSLDDDEDTFCRSLDNMPWLALPYKDKCQLKLIRYFKDKSQAEMIRHYELPTPPTLVVIGPDGKTLHTNAVQLIEEHGSEACPFTPEKLAHLAEIDKEREASQTLESILVSGDLNYVIRQDETKVPVSDLVGKNILLYFAAYWCIWCMPFLTNLERAYYEIKEKDDDFEVIFISNDRDQTYFDCFIYEMPPWLALPFEDPRAGYLSRKFKFQGSIMLVAIGPDGKTVTKEAASHIDLHGANAYPFTEEHIQKLEEKYMEMTKGWPEKLKHPFHKEHDLELTRRWRYYSCDGCNEWECVWSFHCKECDFDLDPECALKENNETMAKL